MKFVLILFVLCINLILGSAIYDGPYWNRQVQICGPQLGAEMSIICKGNYNDDQRKYDFSKASDINYNNIVHW